MPVLPNETYFRSVIQFRTVTVDTMPRMASVKANGSFARNSQFGRDTVGLSNHRVLLILGALSAMFHAVHPVMAHDGWFGQNNCSPGLCEPEVVQPQCPNCCDCLTSFGTHAWDPCGRPSRYFRSHLAGRIWFRSDLLAWGTKGTDLPALVTSSPAVATLADLDDAGVLGDPGTTIIGGNETINNEFRLGGRLQAGFWFDLEQTVGIDFEYFGFDGKNSSDFYQGNGDILARPFFNVGTGQNDSVILAHPSINTGNPNEAQTYSGNLTVQTNMEFAGTRIGFRHLTNCSPTSRVECLGGYRFLGLDDRVSFIESTSQLVETTVATVVTDSTLESSVLQESFHASSEFHGFELGMRASRWWNRMSVEVLGKLAVGGSWNRIETRAQRVGIVQSTSVASVAINEFEGLLVQDENRGRIESLDIGIVGELGISGNYRIHENTVVGLGYTLILWNDVARAAEHVSLNSDPVPALVLRDESFWAQGLHFQLSHLF